ncbi:MAG: hypothetical protein IKJ29_07860 [Akkermansia sp.]|nr:hypothetical protein [Akkermansia sp.]
MKIQTIASILSLFIMASCGEKEQAAVKVMHNKAVDALVEQVGKADVALELYKMEFRKRKENWIRMKQLSLSYERRANEAAQAAQKYRTAGKENLAQLKEQESQKFASRVAVFKEREVKVEESFKTYQLELEEKKVALQILKDEVSALQAMGSLGDDMMIDQSEERLEKARELEESIKQDCDRAQAAIDVNLSAF